MSLKFNLSGQNLRVIIQEQIRNSQEFLKHDV